MKQSVTRLRFMSVPCFNNKYKIIIFQTLTVVYTSLLATSVLFVVTCNSKKPSTKPAILLVVLNSPVSLSGPNTVLRLAGTGTVSIIDGAREKNPELTSLYVIGLESEWQQPPLQGEKYPQEHSGQHLKT
jgi:hypothetical protein